VTVSAKRFTHTQTFEFARSLARSHPHSYARSRVEHRMRVSVPVATALVILVVATSIQLAVATVVPVARCTESVLESDRDGCCDIITQYLVAPLYRVQHMKRECTSLSPTSIRCPTCTFEQQFDMNLLTEALVRGNCWNQAIGGKTASGGYAAHMLPSQMEYFDMVRFRGCEITTSVDGGFSEWSSWFLVEAATCQYARTRECTQPPPMNGGRNCTGYGIEYREGDRIDICSSSDRQSQSGSIITITAIAAIVTTLLRSFV
jgi:hypothetical protein